MHVRTPGWRTTDSLAHCTMAFVVFLSCVIAVCSAAPDLKTPRSSKYVGLDVEHEKAKVGFGGDVFLWSVPCTYVNSRQN